MSKPTTSTPKWVGSALERSICALLLTLLASCLYFKPQIPKLLFFVLCIASFASVVFSSRSLYAPWMKFVELLNLCMSTLIFSIVYFTVVPVISLCRRISKLSSANSSENRESFWIDKKQTVIDQDFFKRMG